MAASVSLLCWTGILLVFQACRPCSGQTVQRNYSIPAVNPENCRQGGAANGYDEFYDISALSCKQCSQNRSSQVATSNGLACECTGSRKLTENFGGATISCEECPTGKVASMNKWECVVCKTGTSPDGSCPMCNTEQRNITAERDIDGAPILDVSNSTAKSCVTCLGNTLPGSEGRRCERCNQILSVAPTGSCSCPYSVNSVCFNSSNEAEPNYDELYTITYENNQVIDSDFLRSNLRAAEAGCRPRYSNLTACQVLGNACVMLMYTRRTFTSDQLCGSDTTRVPCKDACSLYDRVRQLHGADPNNDPNSQWQPNMPWLYYDRQRDRNVLTDTAIPTVYNRGSLLNFTLAAYNATGKFLGQFAARDGFLQLCKDDISKMEAAFTFGSKYRQTCSVSVRRLYNDPEFQTIFYDPYLEFTSTNGQAQKYAVPVLINNYLDESGQKVNEDNNRQEEWQLVRRIFLVDRVSGFRRGDVQPQVVRYPQSLEILVTLQDGNNEGQGRIFPPRIRVTYAEVKLDDYQANRNVQVAFEVNYNMGLDTHNRELSIAMGVFSALAAIYAVFLAANYNRRSGKMAIDFLTLIKFVLFGCGTLANSFFVVILGWSIWWLIIYKRQTVAYLVPTDATDPTFRAYLGSAFALKALQIIHIFVVQVTADIFFIDWERPRTGQSDLATQPPSQSASRKRHANGMEEKREGEVSAWRTYFVANEWNELQIERRIPPSFHLLILVLILEYFNVKNVARYDFSSDLIITDVDQRGEFVPLFRFALSASIYILIGVALWAFAAIYERFWRFPVQNFVDFCSMCNVSVFIMSHDQFGYYLHGRSPHGQADVGLRDLYSSLGREQDDLCGNRGLLPGSDQQTFEMALPRKLRTEYQKVMLPINTASRQPRSAMTAGMPSHSGTRGRLSEAVENQLAGYDILNRFLQSFLNHSLRKVDYSVKEKNIFEKILDTEFMVDPQGGVLYPDGGHSFDRVLYFGQEVTLQMFLIMLFAVTDLAATNYVLAGVITYIGDLLLRKLRENLGKNNLAKKTMIDPRFMI